jgi:hypothetical protein
MADPGRPQVEGDLALIPDQAAPAEPSYRLAEVFPDERGYASHRGHP